MIVYIAAPYNRRQEARTLMRSLVGCGIDVLARWLVVEDMLDHASALKDLDDIDKCDALIAYGPEAWRGEGAGRHAEFGYALAKGKMVILYGARTMIFHYLDDVYVVSTFDALVDLLTRAPVAEVEPVG